MEPAPEIIAECKTIGKCFGFAGFIGQNDAANEAVNALWATMGCTADQPSSLLSIATDTDVDNVLRGWTIPLPPTEEGASAQTRAPNFIELSKARLAIRYAKLHHGVITPQPGSGTNTTTDDTVKRLADQITVLAKAQRRLWQRQKFHSKKRWTRFTTARPSVSPPMR